MIAFFAGCVTGAFAMVMAGVYACSGHDVDTERKSPAVVKHGRGKRQSNEGRLSLVKER